MLFLQKQNMRNKALYTQLRQSIIVPLPTLENASPINIKWAGFVMMLTGIFVLGATKQIATTTHRWFSKFSHGSVEKGKGL